MSQSVVLPPVLVCFSSIRWDFLYQRPQHLLSRFAQNGTRVFYIESKQSSSLEGISLERETRQRVEVIRPLLPAHLGEAEYIARMRSFISELLGEGGEQEAIFWYYNPAAIRYTDHLRPALLVYDCLGEPEHLPGAHPDIQGLEAQLLDRADVVFTSGNALMKSRKKANSNIHVFPNSIDLKHFKQARTPMLPEPEDQAGIPHPRFGYYGIINEHFNGKLIAQVAESQSDWHFVLVGPLVNLDPGQLPQASNIHYLGTKPYADLPRYVSGWDLGLVPLKEERGTQTIFPAKVSEYLAAGVRVLSSPLEEIVASYGRKGLVQVISGAEVFANAAASLLDDTPAEKESWMRQVDAELSGHSWDRTYEDMVVQLQQALTSKRPVRKAR